LEEPLKTLSPTRLKSFFDSLSTMPDALEFINNIKTLQPSEVISVLNSIEETEKNYNNTLRNKFQEKFRDKERFEKAEKERILSSQFAVKLRTIPKEYLQEIFTKLESLTFIKRHEFAVYLTEYQKIIIDKEVINFFRSEITKATEVDYQLLKIIILTILYGE